MYQQEKRQEYQRWNETRMKFTCNYKCGEKRGRRKFVQRINVRKRRKGKQHRLQQLCQVRFSVKFSIILTSIKSEILKYFFPVSFLVCWVPFFTCNILDALSIKYNLNTSPGNFAFQATTLLGYINSCLNPLIYTIFNPEFRKAFKNILRIKLQMIVLNA